MTTLAPPLTRVAIFDDHLAVGLGLEAMLARESDMVPVGFASTEAELWPLLHRTRPWLVILDLHHRGRDGVALSLHLKGTPSSPRIVVYSGVPADALTVAAAVAGADAVVSKADTRMALMDAIRSAARGRGALPPVTLRAMAAAAHRVALEDHPILAMRVAGTPFDEIARTLRISAAEVVTRSNAIVGRLAAWDPMPEPAQAPSRAPGRYAPTPHHGRVKAGWSGR